MAKTTLIFSEITLKNYETVMHQEGDKKLTVSVFLEHNGIASIKYMVYQNNSETPLMSTGNIKDALIRYNAIEANTTLESVEHKSSGL